MTFEEYADRSLTLLREIRDMVEQETRPPVGGDLPIRVVSVTTTAGELCAVTVGQRAATYYIYNLDLSGAKTLWVGDGSVATNRGAFIRAGQVLPVTLPPGQRIFAVSPTGTISVALVKVVGKGGG